MMRLPVFGLLVCCVVVAAFSECTVQRRHYRKGFYVHRPAPHNTVPARPGKEKTTVTSLTRPRQAYNAGQSSAKVAEVLFAGTENNSAMVPVIRNSKVHEQAQPAGPIRDLKNLHVAGSAPGKKKVHILGLLAFVLSIGAWFVLEVFALPLFIIAAALSFYSINRISRDPEKYMLKTLSLVALILSLVGVALSLFLLVLLLFS